jgi:formate dehydrogenase maturation protein FdhE
MSLVLVPASQLAVCSTCTSNRVTSLTMTLTDGTSVDFASCHSCESKSWTQAGRPLDIATVLIKAQKHKVA